MFDRSFPRVRTLRPPGGVRTGPPDGPRSLATTGGGFHGPPCVPSIRAAAPLKLLIIAAAETGLLISREHDVKIALLTDAWFPQVNGVVRTLDHVREELEAMGHEMLVISPADFKTYPLPRYPEIRLAFRPARAMRRRLDEARPDAIHIATEGPIGWAGRRYCTKRRVPFSTSYHTQFPLYLRKYAGVPHGLTYAVFRWFHGGSQGTLVPTKSIKRELDAVGFRNVKVWTRGVNHELFHPRDRNFLQDERPIFMYVGRVAVEKNIEAFLQLDLPGTKYIVGDGPARATLERRFPRVRFVGVKHGEELARHYAAADVFVFPSHTDTFGIVMLEAMASGVPVAAYPVTGPIDVVENGVSGMVHEDLRKACLECLEIDPERCLAYARNFTWRRCAEMFRDNLAPINWSAARGLA